MLSPRFYTLENVDRVRYAQMVVIALVVIVCGYLAFNSVMSMREIWTADKSLRMAQAEWSRTSREMQQLKQAEVKMPSLSGGGVEFFAVQFSEWAVNRGLKVESLVPEGTPVASEINSGSNNLGTWNLSKIRVQGYGNFEKLMDLLEEFTKPQQPIKLESIALQSSENGGGAVHFDLVLSVYEKKAEAS